MLHLRKMVAIKMEKGTAIPNTIAKFLLLTFNESPILKLSRNAVINIPLKSLVKRESINGRRERFLAPSELGEANKE
ncbi:hypothetical protein H5T88_05440 [bacterium]|nr:hypothetical protein [bacterium]